MANAITRQEFGVLAPVTIIIPTYNRAKALEVVWRSYLGHPLVKRIIVVNDGSTDETKKVLECLIEHSATPVSVIHHSEKRGQQVSRLAGLAEADTEWVLFGEDDVWLGEDYVCILYQEAKKLKAQILAGRIVNVLGVGSDFDPSILDNDDAPCLDNIFDVKRFVARFEARSKGPLSAPFLHSVALIHRSVFEKVTFDNRYRGTAHREETDFYLSANDAGFSVYWTPAVACYHLRGSISFAGGHRGNKLNWVRTEFWGFVNTWMLVNKHWCVLKNRYGFEKSPLFWFLLIYCKERALLYLERIASGKISKTWSIK